MELTKYCEWENAMGFAEEITTNCIKIRRFGAISEKRGNLTVFVVIMPRELKRKSEIKVEDEEIPTKRNRNEENEEFSLAAKRRQSADLRNSMNNLQMDF